MSLTRLAFGVLKVCESKIVLINRWGKPLAVGDAVPLTSGGMGAVAPHVHSGAAWHVLRRSAGVTSVAQLWRQSAAHYVPVTRNLKGGRTARNAAEFRQRHVIGGF